MTHIESLAEALRTPTAHPIFVTGAGLSLASGIPTFRDENDPQAVWSNNVVERGTLRHFLKHPADSWKWYLSRFQQCAEALPNPGHLALAEIEQKLGPDRCLTVTQNVDGLHLKAGQQNLIEVHGSARKARCTSPECVYGGSTGFIENPVLSGAVPACPQCGSMLRPHVLWFDESYRGHKDYRFQEIVNATLEWTCLVFIGTSHAVGITDLMYEGAAGDEIPIYDVNPRPITRYGVTQVPGKGEEVLPELLRLLG